LKRFLRVLTSKTIRNKPKLNFVGFAKQTENQPNCSVTKKTLVEINLNAHMAKIQRNVLVYLSGAIWNNPKKFF
jgi:hypothetical protein